MKILVALMGNLDSFEMARPLLRTLSGAGVEVVLVHYSSEELLPIDDLIETGARYLPLSDGGFGTIPRLSRRQYRALCGDDVDFLGCRYHDLARLGFPTTRDYLDRDSPNHQRFRGFAYRAEVLLRECRPDAVIVNHGSEPLSKILHAKATALGFPTLLMESAFVPGRLLLDPVGMHFFPGQNRIEAEWPLVRERELEPEQRGRLARYLEDWRGRGTSKYTQVESEREVEALRAFVEGGRRVLFVVDQIPYDANVINGFRAFRSFAEMVDLARERLPEGWSAVYKHHPRNPASRNEPPGLQGDRFLAVRDVSIHRLFGLADAVLTYSSNVGLEALACDLPVIVGGLPHYADRGLTLDMRHTDEFLALLEQSAGFRPDPALRERFLHHVLFDYLIDVDDAPAILRRIEEAGASGRDAPSRCPFSRHYLPQFEAFRELADSYDRLADENLAHEEIASRIGLAVPEEAEGGDRSRPGGVVDLAVVDESGMAASDRCLYRLAREFVAPGMDVLDLGCGPGAGTYLLADGTGARRVVGVDGSAGAIEHAREFWGAEGVDYTCSSAGAYRMEEASFDVIVSFGMVERLANALEFVASIWRALRPGGVLLLSATNQLGSTTTGLESHVEHYSAEGLRGLLGVMPGVDDASILGQVDDARIEGRAAGRHLIAVARKSDAGPGRGWLTRRLGGLLPYEPPALEARPRAPLRFRPHRFSTDGGRAEEGAIIATPEAAGRYVAYGPFARMATGAYAAGFLLGLQGEPESADGPRAVLDVATGEGRSLAQLALDRHRLAGLTGGRRLVLLPFLHERGEEVLQFRVYLDGAAFRGRIEFHGVELRGRGMREDDAMTHPDPFAQAAEVLDLALIERRRTEAALGELDRVKGEFAQARASFAEADAFYRRAREDWEERFRQYERRLVNAERDREDLLRLKDSILWERDELARYRDELIRQREELAGRCDQLAREVERITLVVGTLVAERDEYARQLAATQAQLRPYRVIDRMGVVGKGYGFARKIKRRLVS